MKTKTILLGSLSLMVGIALAGCTTQEKNLTAMNNGQQKYCSSDGTLVTSPVIQSHRSYCIQSNAAEKSYTATKAAEYAFSIKDDQGNILKDFAITHTKPMHVIVVRKDLSSFQHVHPEFNQSTGTFTISDLTFPTDGQYRIFADFAATGGQMGAMGMPLGITTFEDINIGNTYVPQPLGSEERNKTFDNSQVALGTEPTLVSGKETMLTFDLKQNDKAVTDLQEYLGALGHSVILREGTLDFIHAHPVEDVTKPQTGKVTFMVNFPEAGKYKVFTQFQRAGKVFTADFVISVEQGEENTGMMDKSNEMPGMDHSMMGH